MKSSKSFPAKSHTPKNLTGLDRSGSVEGPLGKEILTVQQVLEGVLIDDLEGVKPLIFKFRTSLPSVKWRSLVDERQHKR